MATHDNLAEIHPTIEKLISVLVIASDEGAKKQFGLVTRNIGKPKIGKLCVVVIADEVNAQLDPIITVTNGRPVAVEKLTTVTC